METRKATKKDYEQVNRLYYEEYSYYHENLPDQYKKMPKTTLSQGTFLNLIEDEHSFVIVASIKRRLVGFLYASIENSGSDKWTHSYCRVIIEELLVDSKFMNMGVDSKLIEMAEAWAKNLKATEVTALMYSFENEACKFYEKSGYLPYSIKFRKRI